MASIPNALAISFCNQIVDSLDIGGAAQMRFYDGVIPASLDAALSGNTQLAALAMSNPAFGDAADANPHATAVANAIASDPSADATGQASFVRIFDGGGTPRLQLTVTQTGGGGEVQVDSVNFIAGQPINITGGSFTFREF